MDTGPANNPSLPLNKQAGRGNLSGLTQLSEGVICFLAISQSRPLRSVAAPLHQHSRRGVDAKSYVPPNIHSPVPQFFGDTRRKRRAERRGTREEDRDRSELARVFANAQGRWADAPLENWKRKETGESERKRLLRGRIKRAVARIVLSAERPARGLV